MLKIKEMCKGSRYSDILEKLINRIGGVEVLKLDYESDYQGHVDIDVLLNDGRVFSYKYYYGSCGVCDDWEDRVLSDDEIEKEMEQEATFFNNKEMYEKWIYLRKINKYER